jgi:tetratricopeptide (TPR) repeat protein
VIISRQVIGLAAKPLFDYDTYVDNIEEINAHLTAASYPEVVLELRDIEEKENSQKKANVVLNKMIQEYEQLQYNPKQRQHALEEIAALTYWTQDYEKAFLKAHEALAEYPKSLCGSTVLMMCSHERALSKQRSKDYAGAIQEYENMLDQEIAYPVRGCALYFLAKMHEQDNDKAAAIACYKQITQEYQGSSWAQQAQVRIEKNKQ